MNPRIRVVCWSISRMPLESIMSLSFTLADRQMKLTNSNTVQSTTPELDVQIERLSQQLADC